jgi:asparagine synthase (glutamine-hydrolysing)
MCGICGQFNNDSSEPVDLNALNRMSEALVHRGPDDEGKWNVGHVALAARRLSIQDVQLGHQPMVSKDTRWALVLNGEIYNTQELRSELEGVGVTFDTRCDTEVAVESFARWGEEAVTRFNGMFAIAAYHVDSDSLILVRDRLGIKPLFYARTPQGILFSSELHSLMRSDLIDKAINYDSIDAFLAYQYIPAPNTIYRSVQKLMPGHILRIDGNKTQLKGYWTLNYSPDPSWTLDSAAERFWDLLSDSVKLRLLSDVPLGAFLSGGIDSSSIVAAMAETSAQSVKTFSIGFDDSESNELPFANEVAAHFATEHVEAILKPDWQSILPSMIQSFGEPFGDSSALPTYLVNKIAREKVTVALTGDGGDESWAGYSWMHMNDRVNPYRQIPSAIRRCISLGLRFAPARPYWEKVRRYHGDSFLTYRESYRRRQMTFDDSQRVQILNPRIAESLEVSAKEQYEGWLDSNWNASDQDWMLAQDTHCYLPDDILTKMDRMSMAVSLEARVPMLDHRLVEFAATVPFGLKYAKGESKRIPKLALKGKVPDSILTQRKRGFSIPIQRWFREDWSTLFKESCMNESCRTTAVLNPDYISRLYREHLEGREEHGHRLWSILVLEHWLLANS